MMRNFTKAEASMTLVTIHGRLANTAILFVILMALWSFWKFFRKQKLSPSYSGAMVVAEILILAQSALGLVVAITGHYASLERPYMHILYGVVSALVIPALYVYTRADERYQVMLIYGISMIFLAFIVWRLMVTGA
jgi:heme A synthase